MRRIFRYQLKFNNYREECEIKLPAAAKIIAVSKWENNYHVYAEINERNIPETRRFLLVYNSHSIPDEAIYVASVQDKFTMTHLYELPN